MQKFKTTCAIITNNQGQILLIKRGREPYRGYWSLVSGIGESKKGFAPEQAVLGEVLWDIGTPFLNSKRLFSLPIVNSEFADELVVFSGNIDESAIKLQPGYSEDLQWVSRDNTQVLQDLAFEHSGVIAEYLMRA